MIRILYVLNEKLSNEFLFAEDYLMKLIYISKFIKTIDGNGFF